MPKTLIKNNLKEARLSVNLTLNDIATVLGTSASNIKNIEARNIGDKTIFKYVSLLMEKGVPINQILTDEKK
jgi:transcriptional regulator with XRE-family HTH domain